MSTGRQSEGVSLLREMTEFPHEEQGGMIFCKQVNILRGRSQSAVPFLHQHEHVQLVLTFEKAVAEVSWLESAAVRSERLTSHQFCFIPPHTLHASRWAHNAEIVILLLDTSAFIEHVQHALTNVVWGDLKTLCRADALLWPLAEAVRNVTENVPSSAASSLSLTLAARILDLHHIQAEKEASTVNRLPAIAIEKISAYIDSHLKTELDVNVLARQVGLSPIHFGRVFKITEGTTPTQYIAKRRVEKALELLETGDYRVAEAACEVGFYDQSHLDRHCRKFFGQPPKFLVKSVLKAS